MKNNHLFNLYVKKENNKFWPNLVLRLNKELKINKNKFSKAINNEKLEVEKTRMILPVRQWGAAAT